MIKGLVLAILLTAIPVTAQRQFKLTDASKNVDVGIEVGKCDMGNCSPLTVTFYRKKAVRSFQTIRIPHTSMWDPIPNVNVTRRYDDQSVINFGDFDFDGVDDVAICDGTNGGYGMPSYQIY